MYFGYCAAATFVDCPFVFPFILLSFIGNSTGLLSTNWSFVVPVGIAKDVTGVSRNVQVTNYLNNIPCRPIIEI